MDLIPWRNKGRRGSMPEVVERPLSRMRDEIDRLFTDPWSGGLPSLWSRADGFPQIELAESDDDIAVRAEMPGVSPEDVRIEVTGNVLKLSGEKSAEKEEKGRNYHFSERQYGSFSRMIQLPSSVDADKVDATYKDGVLTITLPKRAEAKPRRIPVRGA